MNHREKSAAAGFAPACKSAIGWAKRTTFCRSFVPVTWSGTESKFFITNCNFWYAANSGFTVSCPLTSYLRMAPRTFDTLLELLKARITKQDTRMRKAIPADHRLAQAIRQRLWCRNSICRTASVRVPRTLCILWQCLLHCSTFAMNMRLQYICHARCKKRDCDYIYKSCQEIYCDAVQ